MSAEPDRLHEVLVLLEELCVVAPVMWLWLKKGRGWVGLAVLNYARKILAQLQKNGGDSLRDLNECQSKTLMDQNRMLSELLVGQQLIIRELNLKWARSLIHLDRNSLHSSALLHEAEEIIRMAEKDGITHLHEHEQLPAPATVTTDNDDNLY